MSIIRNDRARFVAALLLGAGLLIGCGKSKNGGSVAVIAPADNKLAPFHLLPNCELGEVFDLDEWTIQMPKGYGLQCQEQRDGVVTASWQANDESSNRIIAVRFMASLKGKPTPAQLRVSLISQLNLAGCRESEPELVPIGGRNFERVFMTYYGPDGMAGRGFQYVSVGQPSIAMTYHGDEFNDETLSEADAAARSLRQR